MPDIQTIVMLLVGIAAVGALVWSVVRQNRHEKENPPEVPTCVACGQVATDPVPIAAQSRRNAIIGALVDGDAGSQYGQGTRAIVAYDTSAARLCSQHRRVGEHLVEQFELHQASESAELKAKQSHEAADFESTFFDRIRDFGNTPTHYRDDPTA